MIRVTALAAILIAAAGYVWHWQSEGSQAANKSENAPRVVVMTSLPIIWGDGASMTNILSGEASPAPIYSHWQTRYQLSATDSFEDLISSDTDAVILAQPRAMDPADIAVLDEWLRAGGRALILTDPALVWHSDFALGDNRAPLRTGLLSPLLGHWGLELMAPSEGLAGPVELELAQTRVPTIGIGTFRHLGSDDDGNGTGEAAARCVLVNGNFVAHCTIGKGRAILVADADFLDEEHWVDDGALKRERKSGAMMLTDMLIAELLEPR